MRPTPSLLFFIFFLFFSVHTSHAQDYDSKSLINFKNKTIESPYLDIGGMFVPLASSVVNFHIGFGFQKSTFLGIGVSYNTASSWQSFNDKFNGFGFDYRIQSEHWWIKNTFGLVNNYFPSQKSFSIRHAPSEKNKYYYRASLGWIPNGGIFTVGLAYHLTDSANFEVWPCEFSTPNCEFSNQNRNLNNLQLFIGVSLPNPNRKNLDRLLLLK